MNFKSAYIRLTVFYVVILMVVSIIFSVVIYEISSQEIRRDLGHQDTIFRSLPQSQFSFQPISNLEKSRLDQINESSNRLRANLLYFNLVILLLSAGASYFLAKKTLKPIEEMFNVQNRFTADASHELRTPLTAMKTEIEVNLRDQGLSLNEAKNLLQSNLEEIGKLEDLSNGLLTLAQYQVDQPLSLQLINFKELIEQTIQKIDGLAKTKEIKFNQNLSDVSINGNIQSLSRLLIILLDNAIKYSPKDSEITISLESSGKQATVKIKDQGIGIKSSDLAYIFNPFYRADHSHSKITTEGYGLGLSIAQKIVEFHRGKIEVESKPNGGSTFIIKLPKAT